MECINVQPLVGCGALRFGMRWEEVEQLLGPGHYDDDLNPAQYYGWFRDWSVHIGFRDGRVYEIELADSIGEWADVMLGDIHVFHDKAEDVVAALEGQAACSWEFPDKELSTTYEFPELGVSLWRESAFHPKLYEDPEYLQEFQSMSSEQQEDELRFWHFQSLCLQAEPLTP